MIYQFKQPLMIVGFIVSLVFSLNIHSAEEDTSADVNPQSPSVSPNTVQALEIPVDAKSTIVPTSNASDVRVLIDISGSMKQNDPENLRIPALNLIVEMIPDGAKAGVWTFGQWVNMLVPPATVDSAWREQAKINAQKINSYGLRTNIGEAMEKATWQLEADSGYEQHAILLTDGLVDIAADNDPQQQAKNAAERQRIARDILKQYQSLGVKIHSIGLSDNADKVLLDKLALETGGTSVVVNTAQELVKAFLKAFEKAAPDVAEQVPLAQDNTFDIDASVEEFTALVFRQKGSPPMQLTTPSGSVISQIKGAENARWFGESVYDLVTVTTPEAGKWKIEAELDPDNRVTVVSDLKMEINGLPNTLFPGQQVNFEMFLHEDGNIITNPDFLKLMTIEMTMTAESGRSGTKVISDPENIPQDGRYKESISRLSKEGQYELKVEVDGKTFKRMRKDYIQVRQPIGFEIRKVQANNVPAYAVRVIPQVADIEVARTRVIAKLKGPDQSSIIQAMPWVEEGVWEAVIEPSKGPGEYVIAMNIKGLIGENQEFRVKPDPISLTFPIPEDFTHEYFAQTEEKEASDDVAEVTQEAQPVPAEQPEQTPAEAAEEQVPDAPEAPVMPNLEEKMQQQANESEEVEKPEEITVDDEVVVEDEVVLEPIPYWLYAAIPISILLIGVGGFFIYRKVMSKKLADPTPDTQQKSEDKTDKPPVNLNDGLDDEDFDEDFDLSADDDDELSIDLGAEDTEGLDDLDDTDPPLPEMDDLDDLEQEPEIEAEPEPETDPEPVQDTVEDDIPDFDENFDVDNNTQEDTADDTASAIDELDSVLDSLSDEDEENIPKLDESTVDEFDLSEQGDLNTTDANDEDDASIDAALANLESELDDIDVDALIDDDKKDA